MRPKDTFEHLSGRFTAENIGLDWLAGATILNVSKAISMQSHSHAHMEMMFCLKGELTYEIDGHPSLSLRSGMGIVIPAHVRHILREGTESPSERMGLHLETRPSSRRSCAFFDARDYQSFYATLLKMSATPFRIAPAAIGLVKELAAFLRRPPESLASSEYGLVRILCSLILYRIVAALSRPANLPPQQQQHMEAAIAYIEKHYAETVRMDSLIRHIGYSRSRFFELFKSHTGLSPNDYLIRLRVRKGAELLRVTSRGIAEIAAEVGIPDTAYFSSLFKRYVGKTPTAYRLDV